MPFFRIGNLLLKNQVAHNETQTSTDGIRIGLIRAAGLLLCLQLAFGLVSLSKAKAHRALATREDEVSDELRNRDSFLANSINSSSPISPKGEVLVLDTVSNAPSFSYTSSTPRTYMGDPFNAANPGGSLQISTIEAYMVSTEAQTFSNGLCLRIQFYENFNNANDPTGLSCAGQRKVRTRES